MQLAPTNTHTRLAGSPEGVVSVFDLGRILIRQWKLIVFGALAAGLCAVLATGFIAPTFTARTTLLPPQQQQSSAAAVLSQFGGLAGLTGGIAGIKSLTDQYVAMMQSASMADRIIDEFKLMGVYDVEFREDARRVLGNNATISIGKKDGLITVEVDDTDPARAAAIANAYVDGLRLVANNIAVTEAQQRRVFFEAKLQGAKVQLTKAQLELQVSGINQGALKAEPRAAADGYARLRAEATTAEVRLEVMRRTLAENSPELQQQRATLAALREQIRRAEQPQDMRGDSDYVEKYREFKYQESLFELFARQYELARLDESREGTLIQVLDQATPPERKSKPRRRVIVMFTTLLAGVGLALSVLVWASMVRQPDDVREVAA